MKKAFSMAVAILTIATAVFAAEDWRGSNRMTGLVVDKATGKGVAGAKVSLRINKGDKGGPDLTTDANGKWAILGIAAGPWNVDVNASGYVTRQMSFQVAEGQHLPPMKIEIEPQQVQSAQAEPAHEEVKIGGQVVSKDVADAVENGNKLVGEKKYKEAIAEYEKASAALPNYMPLQLALARAYSGAGELKRAIVAMESVYKADPNNAQIAQLYANMLLEDGQVDKGKAIIDALPAGSLTADALINTGIGLMNKKQPVAAASYFTKAISLDEKSHLGYYYRGLALIQANKPKEAKPDLQKVVELAPNSSEAGEAREYLKSIK